MFDILWDGRLRDGRLREYAGRLLFICPCHGVWWLGLPCRPGYFLRNVFLIVFSFWSRYFNTSNSWQLPQPAYRAKMKMCLSIPMTTLASVMTMILSPTLSAGMVWMMNQKENGPFIPIAPADNIGDNIIVITEAKVVVRIDKHILIFARYAGCGSCNELLVLKYLDQKEKPVRNTLRKK